MFYIYIWQICIAFLCSQIVAVVIDWEEEILPPTIKFFLGIFIRVGDLFQKSYLLELRDFVKERCVDDKKKRVKCDREIKVGKNRWYVILKRRWILTKKFLTGASIKKTFLENSSTANFCFSCETCFSASPMKFVSRKLCLDHVRLLWLFKFGFFLCEIACRFFLLRRYFISKGGVSIIGRKWKRFVVRKERKKVQEKKAGFNDTHHVIRSQLTTQEVNC